MKQRPRHGAVPRLASRVMMSTGSRLLAIFLALAALAKADGDNHCGCYHIDCSDNDDGDDCTQAYQYFFCRDDTVMYGSNCTSCDDCTYTDVLEGEPFGYSCSSSSGKFYYEPSSYEGDITVCGSLLDASNTRGFGFMTALALAAVALAVVARRSSPKSHGRIVFQV